MNTDQKQKRDHEPYNVLKNFMPDEISVYAGKQTNFIITLEKPFQGACIDTIRIWFKDNFTLNNVVHFSPHICCAASTSKAKTI